MALYLAQRVTTTKQPSGFANTVEGALNTHALYRLRNLPVGEGPGTQTQADYDLATAILADPTKVLQPALRLILHSAEQAELADVTSLTDAQVTTMVETVWSHLRDVMAT